MLSDFQYIYNTLGPDNYKFHNKSILLVGSEGFLGKLFKCYFDYIYDIHTNNFKVICIDICNKTDNKRFDYYQLDISSDNSINILDSIGYVDFVINLSGRASPSKYFGFGRETIKVSVHGSMNLLEYVSKYKIPYYLSFSSSEIYGNAKTVPTPENYVGDISAVCPRSSYDQSKVLMRTISYIYNTELGVNSKIIAPFNIFGPQSNDGRVIPMFFNQILNGQKIKIYGDGSQTRTFCYYSDFIIGSIKVLFYGDNNLYNVGNPDTGEISMLDLANKIQEIVGKKGMIEMIEKPKVYDDEPLRRCPDITRAKSIGFEPKISLDIGLKKFYDYSIKNR